MESKNLSIDEILSGKTKVEELNLSAPVHNVLMRNGVNTVLKLISLTEDELLHLENGHLRTRGVHEIESKIASLNIPGLQIGADTCNYDLKQLIELKDFFNDITKLRDKCLRLKSEEQDDFLRLIDNLTLMVCSSIENKKDTQKKAK